MQINLDRAGIMLIMPAGHGGISYTRNWRLQPRDYGQFPPLGLLYIAASLREKRFRNVKVIDCAATGMSAADISRAVSEFRPRLAGITAFTETFAETVAIADLVKSAAPDCHVCVGGPHVKTFPAQSIRKESVDSIVVGEGEDVFVALAESVDTRDDTPEGVVTAEQPCGYPVNVVPELDGIPFPARDLVVGAGYYSVVGIRPRCLSIITSRGCPYRCAFCDVPHKTLRLRSVENVMAEIEECRPGRDTEIFFFDDTFNVSEPRFMEFCEALEPLGLPWSFRGRADRLDEDMLRRAARAGCFQIHLGIETCSDENLARLKKDLNMEQIRNSVTAARAAGVRVIANIMIALPFEKSEREIYANVREIVKLNPFMVQINVFRLIPGTEIFEEAVDKGITSWEEWENYLDNPGAGFTPNTWNEHIPQDRLDRIWQKCYRMFYFRPAKILELLSSLRSAWELKLKFLNSLKLIFGHRR